MLITSAEKIPLIVGRVSQHRCFMGTKVVLLSSLQPLEQGVKVREALVPAAEASVVVEEIEVRIEGIHGRGRVMLAS